ncbi:MAG: YeeE/YedE family protein [Chloroflexia bacterium]|nr:YeeE/YedE family protein [Chloroflexia bacterium]
MPDRLSLICALFGAALGAVFAAAGFNRYDVIHPMLLLQDIAPFLVMGSAIATVLPILRLLERRRWRAPHGGPLVLRRWDSEAKHVRGGIVFGAGWAITGACPGTAATDLGSGRLLGIVLGIVFVAGIALRDLAVRPRPAPPVPTSRSAAG